MRLPHFGNSRQETPFVYYCEYDRELAPGSRCGPLIRDIYIFECNTGGYGSVIINGREFPVTPGDCYILLPGDTVIHTADWIHPREGVYCAVDGLHVGLALARVGITSENPYAPRTLFPQLVQQLDTLAQMQDQADPGAQFRRTALIYQFLGILLRHTEDSSRTDWLQRCIGYMESNYYRPITVSELARVAYLERSYFSVRFKALTGQSPHAYLTSLRIQKACALMTQTGCSISEAAGLTGLDSRNFARVFKKETGMTPRAYNAGK